jgi:hypothetical protein
MWIMFFNIERKGTLFYQQSLMKYPIGIEIIRPIKKKPGNPGFFLHSKYHRGGLSGRPDR